MKNEKSNFSDKTEKFQNIFTKHKIFVIITYIYIFLRFINIGLRRVIVSEKKENYF